MTDGHHMTLQADLTRTLDDLAAALAGAREAARSLQALAPRVAEMIALFEQLDAFVRSGKQTLAVDGRNGYAASPAPNGAVYSRPAIFVPGPAAPAFPPQIANAPAEEPPAGAPSSGRATSSPAATSALPCFRLTLESRAGTLDLRAVDEMVSETAAVRDVALLDFDGRRATLKVWFDGASGVGAVQAALNENMSRLLSPGTALTIVAMELAA